MPRRAACLTTLAAATLLVVRIPAAGAQSAVLTLPDLSPHARVSQRIGLTDLTIDYHRPLVAGRRIFGGVQPYGEVWRAGANANTTFEVTDTVSVEGHPLPPGTYGLHMIPGPTSWVVILSRNSTSWGSFSYDSTEDALRVTVTPRAIPHQEALVYSFDDPSARSVVVTMRWAEVAVRVRVEVDAPRVVARKLRDQLRDQLRGRAQSEWQSWEEVANYLLVNGLDAHEALADAEQSVRIEDRFENEATRARALAALGRAAEARDTRTRAAALGKQPQVYAFGRGLQRLGDQETALAIFREDARRNPGTLLSHQEAARVAVAAGDFDTAAAEVRLAIAAAPPPMKGALQELLGQVQARVDINR